MFKKLKKLLKNLLNLEPEKKPEVSKNNRQDKGGKKRKKNASAKPAKNNSVEKTPKQEKKKNKKSSGKNQSQEVKVPPMPTELAEVPVVEGKTRFLDLDLHLLVKYGIQHAGFEYCTPIQQMSLPPLLEQRDLAGKAQTGTGKTAAFLLASFTKLLNNPLPEPRTNARPRMVVMAPTRELAMQIHKDACELGIFTKLNIAVVFGGMDHETQRRSLDCPLDVLVGTPGRIIDYSRSGALDLSQVEILVIDEADRMLDMGFIPDVKRIVSRMPEKGKRQTLLFSATLEERILNLASGWLADPVIYESEPEKPVSENITQTFYSVLREEKLALVLHILKTMEFERLIIFGNRKDVNLRLQYDLARFGYNVPVLSGDITQAKRIKILERFRSGEERVVIATDVAARGIHVDDISLVINYDLPEQPEDYIHRIGRTGRAGRQGTAISFLCEYGAYYLPAIEELLGTQFGSILPTEEMLEMPQPVENPKLPEREAPANGSSHKFRKSGGNRRGGSYRR